RRVPPARDGVAGAGALPARRGPSRRRRVVTADSIARHRRGATPPTGDGSRDRPARCAAVWRLAAGHRLALAGRGRRDPGGLRPARSRARRVKHVRVGCSGWNYGHWRERVYPKGLPARRWLGHYATLFDTVEVNATFYRLPTRSAVTGWVEQSPDGFVFSIKASRYLTHQKRLTDLDGRPAPVLP